jgi:hypothetical protein
VGRGQPTPGARFAGLSGQVEVRPESDEDAWDFAKMGMVLNVEDHIKTGPRSSAILSFKDLSTFVMKPETEIILSTPPEKESKIQLVAGNIWVNVKKMAKDGTMEVTMNQAVAGIKGTNITCQTDENEDRIQVLRGLAEVLIRETQETILVNEGEELVVKRGGQSDKLEIDVVKAQELWKEEVEKLGDSIDVDEIPDVIRDMLDADAEEFGALLDEFKSFSAEGGTEEEIMEFKKDVERFVGVLLEDTVILASLRTKIDGLLSEAAGDAAQRMTLAGLSKLIGDASSKISGYQSEAGKMLKAKFKAIAVDGMDPSSLVQDVAAVWETVSDILRELQSNPSGLTQDWFLEARDECTQALEDFAELAVEVQEALSQSPQNQELLALAKQISGYQQQVAGLMRDLNVVEVDESTVTEIQETEEVMADTIYALQGEIAKYNADAATAAPERRLADSLRILSNFSTARRLYNNAQRLYTSTLKSASGQKFKSAEQQEMEETFERLDTTFQKLGVVADELKSRLDELESQLGGMLD